MGSTIEVKPCHPGRPAYRGPVWLSLGFRPFFFGGTVMALALMVAWMVAMNLGSVPSAYYGFFSWHAHEMVFGYAVAVMAGFLLTSVRNWTDLPTPTGYPLLALFGLWLAGRLLPFVGWMPGVIIAGVDLLFLPALMASLAIPLFKGDRFPNPFVLPLVGVLVLANLLVHLELLGITSASLGAGLALGVGSVVLMIAFIAGWAVPMFTGRALADANIRRNPTLERAAMAALIAWVVADTVGLPPHWLAPLAFATAGLHAMRMARWSHPGVAKVPLLWVLFTGYGWLVAGLALKGMAYLGWLVPSAATHAFTAGAMGVLTCGMMVRVSLGHTGRHMMADRATVAVFVLVNLAAIIRVAGALMPPDRWQIAMTMAGGVWIGGFTVLLVNFAPIWLGPEKAKD